MTRFKKGRALYMRCRCSCGAEIEYQKSNLLSAVDPSCGCKRRAKSGTMVEKNAGLYKVWSAMIERCYSPTSKSYPDYGARGICVCDRWLKGDDKAGGLEYFVADMGERPVGQTIERVDNNRSYEPGNCEWATRKSQGRNKRNNHLVTFRQRTMPVSAWAEETGIPYFTLRARLMRGWEPERALTTPVR